MMAPRDACCTACTATRLLRTLLFLLLRVVARRPSCLCSSCAHCAHCSTSGPPDGSSQPACQLSQPSPSGPTTSRKGNLAKRMTHASEGSLERPRTCRHVSACERILSSASGSHCTIWKKARGPLPCFSSFFPSVFCHDDILPAVAAAGGAISSRGMEFEKA